MMTINYSISPEIFAKFPKFYRGVVIAKNLKNGTSSAKLIQDLRDAEEALTRELTLEGILNDPRISSWREAYRAVGIKPSEFRPSMEALTRRVLRKDPLPAISTLVDLGNLVSIRHLAPIGAHAIDLLKEDITLRPATGEEIFEPFGSDEIEHPLPGEFIFAEGNAVLTRRWTWRQSKHTLVVPETTAVEINVDTLPPFTLDQVRDICEEVARLVVDECGGHASYDVLTIDHPLVTLYE